MLRARSADGAPRAPRSAVVLPQQPGAVQLLDARRSERVRRVARMCERGIRLAADALPRRTRELHAAEVAVAGVRRPSPFLQMDAARLEKPRCRWAPVRRGGREGEQEGGETGR